MATNIKRWFGSDSVEIAVRIVVAIITIVSLFLFVRQNMLSDCQAEYNQSYAQYAKTARFNSEKRIEQQNELFRAIYEARSRNNTQTQKDIDAAFVKYFTTIELTAAQQALNPPPPLPDDYRC